MEGLGHCQINMLLKKIQSCIKIQLINKFNYDHQVVYGISLFSSYVCSFYDEFEVKFKGASIQKNLE
jgi:hypothetical protein